MDATIPFDKEHTAITIAGGDPDAYKICISVLSFSDEGERYIDIMKRLGMRSPEVRGLFEQVCDSDTGRFIKLLMFFDRFGVKEIARVRDLAYEEGGSDSFNTVAFVILIETVTTGFLIEHLTEKGVVDMMLNGRTDLPTGSGRGSKILDSYMRFMKNIEQLESKDGTKLGEEKEKDFRSRVARDIIAALPSYIEAYSSKVENDRKMTDYIR